MSIALMTEVWGSSLPMTEKMVLLCLADFANDRGQCWPSVDTIAGKCSCSDRTVQKAIKNLKEWGLLTVKDAPGKAHSFTINPRISFTPEKSTPPKKTAKGVKDIRQGGEAASPKPSSNHQEPSEKRASEDALTIDNVFDHWNSDIAPLGKKPVRKRTPERRQLVKARIGQNGLDEFLEVFANIRASPFLLEAKGLQFDWFMAKGNFTKVLEGNYNG